MVYEEYRQRDAFAKNTTFGRFLLNRAAVAERLAGAPRGSIFWNNENGSEIQMFNAQRVVLDKLAARLDNIAHQLGKDVVGI